MILNPSSQSRAASASQSLRPALALTLAALSFSRCLSPEPGAFRHPDFRPADIRRPAVVIQVSLDRTSLLGEGEFSPRQRSAIPQAVEIGLLEGLNAEAILPVDVTLLARPSYRDRASPFTRIDRQLALEQARTLNADFVLILDVHLSRQPVLHCRGGRRPFRVRTTRWTFGAEVLRVSDGTRLLVRPPAPGLRLDDVEPDCDRGRVDRRRTAHEMLEVSVRRGLSLVLGK
ncbi:MAG: hypothetical protein ACE5JN_02065 [Candidatus Methylomirabilia bacterium]